MGRKPRDEIEGGIAHVWARGNNQRRLFDDDEDRLRYLDLLGGEVMEREWRLLAYCLMTNHVHLLIETPKTNLSWGMARAHSLYARSYNVRWGRKNHLFGERYDKTMINSSEHLWFVAAYVMLNPVRAGMCAVPERWPWSSCRPTLGIEAAPRWLDSDRLLERAGLSTVAGPAEFIEYLRVVTQVRGLAA